MQTFDTDYPFNLKLVLEQNGLAAEVDLGSNTGLVHAKSLDTIAGGLKSGDIELELTKEGS